MLKGLKGSLNLKEVRVGNSKRKKQQEQKPESGALGICLGTSHGPVGWSIGFAESETESVPRGRSNHL